MRIPLEVGRAGLSMIMFIFVLAGMILFFTRPVAGSAVFVITVFMLVVSGALVAVLMVLLRITQRTESRIRPDSEERNQP